MMLVTILHKMKFLRKNSEKQLILRRRKVQMVSKFFSEIVLATT